MKTDRVLLVLLLAATGSLWWFYGFLPALAVPIVWFAGFFSAHRLVNRQIKRAGFELTVNRETNEITLVDTRPPPGQADWDEAWKSLEPAKFVWTTDTSAYREGELPE